MAIQPADKSKVTRMVEREPLGTKLARVEEAVVDLAADITDLKTAQMGATDVLDKRLRMLEDVRVRALEDRVLAEKVRDQEREKHADREALVRHQVITRRDAWIGLLVMAAITLLGALVASGHLF